MTALIVLLLPIVGTAAGSAMVFFLKNKISIKTEKILLGFAAGVMIAASVWSLLMPAIDIAKEQGLTEWLPALVGFLAGIAFLLVMDTFIPHLHLERNTPEGVETKLSRTTMLLFAVTLHNIPEGMAVGVTLAGVLSDNTGLSVTGAIALSCGIAIQNFPEGAIISMPLCSEGMSKPKAFLFGVLSGIVEPIAGFITAIFATNMLFVLPYLLSFAAGAMMYVVVDELIPDSQEGKHSDLGTIAMAIGFALMMVLDIALG